MTSYINLIFRIRGLVSVLAHANPHRVTGITLPPVDARDFTFCSFIVVPGLGEAMKKEEERKTALSPLSLCSQVIPNLYLYAVILARAVPSPFHWPDHVACI